MNISEEDIDAACNRYVQWIMDNFRDLTPQEQLDAMANFRAGVKWAEEEINKNS